MVNDVIFILDVVDDVIVLSCWILIGLFCCFCFSSCQIKTKTKNKTNHKKEQQQMVLSCLPLLTVWRNWFWWFCIFEFYWRVFGGNFETCCASVELFDELLRGTDLGVEERMPWYGNKPLPVPNTLTSDQISQISLIVSGFHPFFHPSLLNFLLTWVFYFNLIHRVCLQWLCFTSVNIMFKGKVKLVQILYKDARTISCSSP